jgi:drug/metabolite transporter (DMT)-like permease
MGALMISFSGVWVKISHVTPTVSAFYRVFLGAIFLLIAAVLRCELKWHGKKYLILALVCGLLFALDLVFYHYSVHYVGPGLGTILPNFQAFILAGIGIVVLKEKIQPLFLFSIPLAICGLFLIVGINWQSLGKVYKEGIYFGLTAAVCYALFILSLRKLQSDLSGISLFSVLMIVSLTTSLILSAEIIRIGDSFNIHDAQSFFAMVAYGLFSQSIGWLLIANALPIVNASLSGFILLLQPALAFLWDVIFFQRITSPLNWLGVTIVLFAIYLGTLKKQ